MVSVYIFCHKKEEAELFHNVCSYHLALLGNEKMSSMLIYGKTFIKDRMENISGIDLILYEVGDNCDIEGLKKLRKRFSEAKIMIVARSDISPEFYLVPDIHPTILVLKPYDKEKLKKAIYDLLVYYFHQRLRANKAGRLMICDYEERRYFDYDLIEYFEAREKKIFLSCNHEKRAFYGSLKKIEETLPICFVRCHRSFIVNTLFIERIDFSEYYIYMKDTTVIPISKK